MSELRIIVAIVGLMLVAVAFHAPICRVVACGAP